jgi:hypothetical protein
VHQVRGQPADEQAALVQRLAHQREVEHLQVAQPAVHELAGPAGRARGPVALLEQPDGQAAAGRVEGRAGAGDTAADDEDVEHGAAHRLEGGTAVGG